MNERVKNNGMRPHDIVILLKIIACGGKVLGYQELANSLLISIGEISKSMERNRIAGLVNPEKTQVNRLALREFLIYGLKYVFPPQIGASTRGIPTAHSACLPLSIHYALARAAKKKLQSKSWIKN
jgi:hypothetical protein